MRLRSFIATQSIASICGLSTIVSYNIIDIWWSVPLAGGEMGRSLHWGGLTYTQRHHAHYRTVGGGISTGVDTKRFLREDAGYYWTLSRYIHLNPCNGGRPLPADPETWTYSSFAGYARKSKRVD